MSLVFGVVFSAAAILLYSWAFAQHRRPEPADWTRRGWLSCTIAIVIVTLMPAAAGAIAMAVADPGAAWAGLNLVGLLVIVLSLAAVIWGAPRLIREGRAGGAEVVNLPVRPGGAPKGMKRAA